MFQDAPVPPNMDKHQQSSTGDLKSVDSFDSMDHIKYNNSNNSAERDSLRLMSRKLRQAKRKLFLKKVETPVQPVDKLRDILLKLSMDGGTLSDEYSTSLNSFNNEWRNEWMTEWNWMLERLNTVLVSIIWWRIHNGYYTQDG